MFLVLVFLILNFPVVPQDAKSGGYKKILLASLARRTPDFQKQVFRYTTLLDVNVLKQQLKTRLLQETHFQKQTRNNVFIVSVIVWISCQHPDWIGLDLVSKNEPMSNS